METAAAQIVIRDTPGEFCPVKSAKRAAAEAVCRKPWDALCTIFPSTPRSCWWAWSPPRGLLRGLLRPGPRKRGEGREFVESIKTLAGDGEELCRIVREEGDEIAWD